MLLYSVNSPFLLFQYIQLFHAVFLNSYLNNSLASLLRLVMRMQ